MRAQATTNRVFVGPVVNRLGGIVVRPIQSACPNDERLVVTRPHAPGRPTLETVAEATARNLDRADQLVDRAPEIAIALEASEAAAPCGLIICALSSRRFRISVIRELVRIAKRFRAGREAATIYLATAHELGTLDLAKQVDRYRTRLKRCGFAGSLLIGGIEVAWLNRDRVWILHAHVMTVGVSAEAWAALEKKLENCGRSDPVDHKELVNPERWLSYALKFVTYHKPGKVGENGNELKVPLPPDRLAELAAWWARHRHGDFVFLLGARRRGRKITVDPSTMSALARRGLVNE
jgi:hypothetical protein